MAVVGKEIETITRRIITSGVPTREEKRKRKKKRVGEEGKEEGSAGPLDEKTVNHFCDHYRSWALRRRSMKRWFLRGSF
jgi:hypothetical protein